MKKYTLQDAISALEIELERSITQAEIANALSVSQTNINKRLKSKSEVKISEIHALQKEFKCRILKYLGFSIPNAVEILPYNNPEYEHLIKCSQIDTLWLDRQLVNDKWGKKAKDLCFVSMPGNNMNGGDFPIQNGTQLILDTNLTDILRSGIFAYITNAGFFVNKIKVRADGIVEFIHTNSIVDNREYTQEDLDNMGFKVIGRLIMPMNLYEG
jgi:transcriptional regulator with XRE-family HTH domain